MPQSDLIPRVHALNERYRHHSAVSVLEHALRDPQAGKLALVSSFGAESVVLLHMVSVTRRDTPVIFIDTAMLFAETLVYQQELAERLNLSDLRIIRADSAEVSAQDPDATLHQRDTDACCALRKTVPLQEALSGFDGWITGRKRPEDIRTYMDENRLPRHPLVARGYPSIGCMPCTTPVKPGEDPRSGRWRDQDKTECGIHFVNGKMVRRGVST